MSDRDSTIPFSPTLIERLSNASSVLFLTGAGVSAESGVATFRAVDGLWSKFRPEELANVDAFLANPQMVWEWYQARRSVILEAEPNAGHRAMAEFQNLVPHVVVVTQNIDGLHQEGGSDDVIELHGNLRKNFCLSCHARYDDVDLLTEQKVQRCSVCDGMIRPDVVWFGELLPQDAIDRAEREVKNASVLFSVGTSSVVWPAAGLPLIAREAGAYVVEINPEETPLTRHAHESLRGRSGDLLPQLVEQLRAERGETIDEERGLDRSTA